MRRALPRGPGSENALRRLSRVLAEAYGADEVVLTSSGTHALQLGLTLARELTGRDRVVLPAFTCYDVVTAAIGAGLRPGFYDLDPDTLLPDRRSLDRALEAGPAAVVIVHHFGIPTPIEPLRSPVEDAGAVIIEDAAQGQGGRLDGRPLGSLAPIGVLSFGRGKGWTGGGGGALLLRGDRADAAPALEAGLAPAPASAPAVVKLAAQWLLARPGLYAIPASVPWLGLGETHYRPPTAAARMPETVARLVLANQAAAEAEAEARRARARRLRTLLDGSGLHVPPERGEPGYLRLPVRRPGRAADDLLDGPARRTGILPSYPRPLPTLDAVPRGDLEIPGADTLARELFTAPTHSLLPADLESLAGLLHALP